MKPLKLLSIITLLFVANQASAQQQYVADTVFNRAAYEDSFGFGADVSWYTPGASSDYRNRKGQKQDLLTILKNEEGINAVRFRVWTGNGANSKSVVIKQCQRAHSLGMKIMIDFHYSDTWADPGSQTIPSSWTDHSVEGLCKKVYEHTYDVLHSLKELGIVPKWVQIGNETKRGMLWETGRTNSTQGYKNFAQLINSAYDAIKDVDSTMLAIVHLPDGHDNSLYRSMFDRLTQNGAKFDVIGMSCYPRWSHLDITNDSQVTSTINKYISNMKDVQARYHKPVICVETGHYNNQPLQANHFLAEFMKALIDVGAQGCFYWEPESMGGYELGAWDPDTHQASIAMDAYLGLKYIPVSYFIRLSQLAPTQTDVLTSGDSVMLSIHAMTSTNYALLSHLDFYLNKKKVETLMLNKRSGTFTFSPDHLDPGSYEFYVEAFDTQKHVLQSDTVQFLVGPALIIQENSEAWLGAGFYTDDNQFVPDSASFLLEKSVKNYTGVAYIHVPEAKNSALAFSVHFPEPGTYTILARHHCDQLRFVKLYLGQQQEAGSMLFYKSPKDGDWFFASKDIQIEEAGDMDIVLVANSSKGIPLIDYCAIVSPNGNVLPDIPASINSPTAFPLHSSQQIFDLTGRRLSSQPLRPGIYIQNGKKIFF